MELNRIYNIDCIEGMKAIDDKSIDLVLTDIPYGECNGRKSLIRELNKGIADIIDFELDELTETIARKARQSVYMFCGINQVSSIRIKLAELGMNTRLCIWEKTNPSPIAGEFLWLSNIECCVFGRWPKATFNEFCKGSVWHENCWGGQRIHPTQKPLQLFKRLILASSNEGDLILDPFSGSGTTAIAAKQLKRNFIAFEKNKDFFESSVKRYNEETAQMSLF